MQLFLFLLLVLMDLLMFSTDQRSVLLPARLRRTNLQRVSGTVLGGP